MWLKIKNLWMRNIKKPLVVKKGGKEYFNLNQAMKKGNRHSRRSMMSYAKHHPEKIIYT